MANTFTVDTSIDKATVMGNARAVAGVMTMTDGPGGVSVGLDLVYGGSVTAKTATTGGFVVSWNTTSGNVHIRSCASADTFNVFAFGR